MSSTKFFLTSELKIKPRVKLLLFTFIHSFFILIEHFIQIQQTFSHMIPKESHPPFYYWMTKCNIWHIRQKPSDTHSIWNSVLPKQAIIRRSVFTLKMFWFESQKLVITWWILALCRMQEGRNTYCLSILLLETMNYNQEDTELLAPTPLPAFGKE